MLIDSHAHVNFKSYETDAKETIQRALDSGIWVVNVGSQIDTSQQAVEVAESFGEGVYAVVGLHPEHTHSQYVDEEETHFKSREEIFDYEAYKKLALSSKVVGIGECGLDYYRIKNENSGIENIETIKQKQKEAFRQQIKLAKELDKALVIHSRPEKGNEELYDDLLGILDEESDQLISLSANKQLRFVVHSYTGSPEYLQKFFDRGGMVSFNGIITFDKTGNMEKLVAMAPLDRIILETDCPYLTPVPNRGKRNEPANVRFVAEKLAGLKKLTLEEVEKITTENARRLFALNQSSNS